MGSGSKNVPMGAHVGMPFRARRVGADQDHEGAPAESQALSRSP